MTNYTTENCSHPESVCSNCSLHNIVYILCRKHIGENNEALNRYQDPCLFIKLAHGLHLYGFTSDSPVDPEELGEKIQEIDPITVKITQNVPQCLISKSLIANTLIQQKGLDLFLKEDNDIIEAAYRLRQVAKVEAEKSRLERKNEDGINLQLKKIR